MARSQLDACFGENPQIIGRTGKSTGDRHRKGGGILNIRRDEPGNVRIPTDGRVPAEIHASLAGARSSAA